MTKLKFKPRGMVRPDSVFHLCQEIDGEWYAIITARSDGAPPRFALVINVSELLFVGVAYDVVVRLGFGGPRWWEVVFG